MLLRGDIALPLDDKEEKKENANAILDSTASSLTTDHREQFEVCLFKNLNGLPHEDEIFPTLQKCEEFPSGLSRKPGRSS